MVTTEYTVGKICPKCTQVLPLECFGLVRGKHRSYCRECHRSHIYQPETRTELTCAQCKETKPTTEFNKRGSRFQSSCRECHNWTIGRYQDGKRETGENVEINRRDYRRRNKWRKLKAKYGVTQEQYEALVSQQNNCCAICKQPEREMDGQHGWPLDLSVDHDHVTGKVRGLLCRQCNIALGRFQESVAVLESAIIYLKTNEG